MYSFTVYTHKRTDAFRVVAGEHALPTDAEFFNVRVYQGTDRQAAIDVAYSDAKDARVKAQIERFGVTLKMSTTVCAYRDCRYPIPAKYGKPGVSLSRWDNKSLICSSCGNKEALEGKPQSLLMSVRT